jgi:hypothetical protein
MAEPMETKVAAIKESEQDISKDSSDVSDDEVTKAKKKNLALKKKRPMSEDQVKEWFLVNNLNMDIFEYLSPCNGEILKQLFDMKCNAPEVYDKIKLI